MREHGDILEVKLRFDASKLNAVPFVHVDHPLHPCALEGLIWIAKGSPSGVG